MKKLVILIWATMLSTAGIQAQESKGIRKGTALGFHLTQNQDDFGIGLNATSPYFFKSFAIRVKGNYMWHQHIMDQENALPEYTWSEYNNVSIGLTSIAGEIGTFLRLYGEGGLVFLFPNSDFSSEDSEIGGYGMFGFEFFMAEMASYYIEIGGIGTGAIADQVTSRPIYSNGLAVNVGFRLTLN